MQKPRAIFFAVLFVLALIAVMVYFVFYFGEKQEFAKNIPDKIIKKMSNCNSLNPVKWCSFAKVGDDEYMNCEYIKNNYARDLARGFNPSCFGNDEKIFCMQLKKEKGNEYKPIRVNDKTCTEWSIEVTCNYLYGDWFGEACEKDKDVTSDVLNEEGKTTSDKYCCINKA